MVTTDTKDLCTIVIPTKNRTTWIYRILKFYDLQNFNHKIIIADSSNYQKANLEEILIKFKNLKVNIIECKDLNAEQACNKVASFIDTKYSCFLADDDIINPNFFNKAIDFLNNNPEYSGVTGNSFTFNTKKNSIFAKITDIGEYPVINEENSNYHKRLKNYFLNNYASIFTLTKTSYFSETFKLICRLQPYHQRYMIGEQVCAINYLYFGKIKKINETFLIRQYHNENIYGFRSLYKWLIKEDFLKSHIIIKQLLIHNFRKKNSSLEYEKETDNLLDDFYKKTLKSMIDYDKKKKPNYLKILKKFLKITFIKFGLIKRFECKNLKLYIKFIESNNL